MNGEIEYLVLTEDKTEDFEKYLISVEGDFPVRLSERVNIKEYCKKILLHGKCLAAVCDNTIVGTAAFYCNDNMNYMGYLSTLCVSRNFRKMKIAENLVENMIDIMRAEGMQNVHCFVHKENAAAIRLYQKMGFDISEEIKANAEYSITMARKI